MRGCRKAVSVVVGASLTAMVWTGTAWAQAWVQIEAKPSLNQAEDRARDWAGMFPEISGFRLTSGWYAIAIGPFADDQTANQRLRALRAQGLIPRDSFVADGGKFTQQFWPVGASLGTAPSRSETIPGPGEPDSNIEIAPLPAEVPDAASPPEESAAPEAAAPETAAPETIGESRRLEAALSRDQRREIQTALDWEGSYSGAIDGIFGQGTRASIADWQLKNGYDPTGVLSSAQQQALLDKVASERAELGLEPVTEKEAGISIDLPMGLVKFDRYNAPFVNYAPKDGSGVQVLLISQQGDAARLRGLYDAMQTLEIVPVNGPRDLRGNGFTIEGTNSALQSYTQVSLSQGLIKGFTLVWPKGDEKRMGRVLDAMKSSFKPIGSTALDATLGQPMSVTRAALMAGIEKRAPIFSRSGFFIDANGDVLTAAEGLARCGRITIEDHPADVSFSDTETGFAVLKPQDRLAPKAVGAFRTNAPLAGVPVSVAGFSYPEALPAPVLTFGTLSALKGLDGQAGQARLEARTRAGDAGGPVFDSTGAVIGMLLPLPQSASRVLPDGLSVALQTEAMTSTLSQNGFAPRAAEPSGAKAAEDLQAMADKIVVQISCWK
ncbi:peptidoglycan-binding protein [Thioclava sp. BHET1]|nr:peptidoglycan-binding protein [Thioclava sp. BHET1]